MHNNWSLDLLSAPASRYRASPLGDSPASATYMHCECVHSNRCVVMGALSGCVVVDVPHVGNVGSGVQAGPGGDGRDPHMHWPCARRGCSCPDLSVCCCRSRPGLRLWP